MEMIIEEVEKPRVSFKGVKRTGKGMERFKVDLPIDVNRIDLSHGKIIFVNLDTLANCSNLEELDLSHNLLEEIQLSFLKKMKNKVLKSLSLAGNMLKIIDLTPLQGFESLEFLSLDANDLEKINLIPLKNLDRLLYLNLARNKLREINLNPIAGNLALQHLSLAGNRLSKIDLSSLKNLRALQHLDLSGNELTKIDLTPLKNLKKLNTLLLHGNKLLQLDVTPLASNNNLKRLVIDKSVKLILPAEFQDGRLPKALEQHWEKIAWK